MKRLPIAYFRLPRAQAPRSAAHSSFPIPHSTFNGFTVLELLTAMAVLALILVMMVQVVNGVLQSTRTQSQQMESVSTARRAIDVMANDLQNAVVGQNTAILAPDGAGGNLLAVLTARRGTNGAANHRFLVVSYATNTSNQLLRSYGSVDFSATDLLAAATNTSHPVEPLAGGILAIQIRAVTDSTNFPLTNAASANWATNNYNGITPPSGYKALLTYSPAFSSGFTNRTRGLEIWIAAVDDQNFKVLSDSSKLSVAQGVLGADPAAWRLNIDAAAIPPQAKSGIRILKKSIPLR
jgi:type II secretory pathway pseudopilin PulG